MHQLPNGLLGDTDSPRKLGLRNSKHLDAFSDAASNNHGPTAYN